LSVQYGFMIVTNKIWEHIKSVIMPSCNNVEKKTRLREANSLSKILSLTGDKIVFGMARRER
jgi:hypothetical protein